MKRRIKPVLAILAFLALVYYFFYEIALPYAAKANIPARWHNIPLGQKRMIVHEYLGLPSVGHSWDVKADFWFRKVKKNSLHLEIRYNMDTAAAGYKIMFYYNSWLLNKKYTLEEESFQ